MRKKKTQTEDRNLDRNLRNAAEGKLAQSLGAPGEMREKTLEEVIHELQVHQIELEMQNEELRKAQLALEESRERYADLYDFAPVGYFTINQEALIKEVNLTGAILLGVVRQELTNSRFRRFVAPADFGLWDRHFLSVFQQDERQSCDLMLKRPDGSTFYAGLQSIRMEGSRGAFEVHTAITDITERKQAEEILHLSEERYRDLVENSQDLICTHDLEGNLLSVNEAPVRALGYSREFLMQVKMRDLLTPEQHDQFEAYLKKLKEEGRASGVLRLQTATGETRYWEYDNTLRTEGVAAPIVRGMAHDVTERRRAEKTLRKSEENYRSIFENSVEGIYQSTPEGRFLTVNPAMARMYGYGSSEEMIEAITDIGEQLFVNPEQRSEYIRTLEEKGEVKGYELQVRRKDGTLFWISNNGRAKRDSTGKTLYYDGLSEDITSRLESDKRLKENMESLRKALGGIIQVISATVEVRDPYTAGHQQRVADLARTMAQEMELSEDQVDGLRLAGTIHDLGKASIPAEILSKPTKLTDLEYRLIQTHSQTGFNILKGVDFPWPIA